MLRDCNVIISVFEDERIPTPKAAPKKLKKVFSSYFCSAVKIRDNRGILQTSILTNENREMLMKRTIYLFACQRAYYLCFTLHAKRLQAKLELALAIFEL